MRTLRDSDSRAGRSWFSRLAVTLIAVCALAPVARSELVFHASFEGGSDAQSPSGIVRADRALSPEDPPKSIGDRIPGRLGHGRVFKQNSQWGFDARNHYSPRAGTLAFFFKRGQDDYPIDIFQVEQHTSLARTPHLRVTLDGDQLVVRFSVPPESSVVLRTKWPQDPTGSEGDRWTHLALTWDSTQGIRVYQNGSQIAASEPSQSWRLVGLEPERIIFPAGKFLPQSAWVAFDELMIYDQPLAPNEVERVYRSARPVIQNTRLGPSPRAEDYGWEGAPAGLPIIWSSDADAHLPLQQVGISDARSRGGDCSHVGDGRPTEGWPECGRRSGKPETLEVLTDRPFDTIVIDGRFEGKITTKGNPDGTSLDGKRIRSTVQLSSASSNAATFVPRKSRPSVALIGELDFWRRQNPKTGAADTMPDPGTAHFQEIPAWKASEVFEYQCSTRLGIGSIHLDLSIDAPFESTQIRVRLFEPLDSKRSLASLDLALPASQRATPHRLVLTLDVLDRVCLPGDRIAVELTPSTSLRVALPDHERVLAFSAVTDAKQEFVSREILFAKSRYRGLSEPRPWTLSRRPEVELARNGSVAARFFEALERLRSVAPGDRYVETLWFVTHRDERNASRILPSAVEGFANAPEWALLQRELDRRLRRVTDWWIQVRQNADGSLGGGWGDDTDFIQNFPMLAFIRDVDGRLAASAAQLADGLFHAGQLQGGLNKKTRDTLHAYEEGINAQIVAAQLNPGKPRFQERIRVSAEAVRERLMAKDSKGRLRFRSSYFGSDEVRTRKKWGYDQTRNVLMLHPALHLAFTEGDATSIQIARDWAAGWLDLWNQDHEGGKRIERTLLDGSVVGRRGGPPEPAFYDLLLALGELDQSAVSSNLVDVLRGGRPLPVGITRTPSLFPLLVGKSPAALLAWAHKARLDRPADDDLGKQSLRRYRAFELSGDRGAALDSLRASLRRMRIADLAMTWAEPSPDRIWLPGQALAAMALGGVPHERNQLWPRHRLRFVGYEDHVSWVSPDLEKSGKLELRLYSFASGPDEGAISLVRPVASQYRLVLETEERVIHSTIIEVRRGVPIPITLPSGVELRLRLQPVETSRS